jgi:hypothetical protein
MKRALPVTGISQASLYLEASLEVSFNASFVGYRNGQHHAVQSKLLKSPRDQRASRWSQCPDPNTAFRPTR